MTEPTPRKPSALAVASDLLAPLVPRLLVAFAALRPGRPPQSLRALQPLALVFLLEAFGLACLLTDEQRAAAWQAARGPGRGKAEDEAYDPTDDSDETKVLRWVAARAAAEDKAYRVHARAVYDDMVRRDVIFAHRIADFREFMQTSLAPDRAEFSRQWGARNPIDPTTAPACFDPRAQLSILDAVSPERDGVLGLFVAESRLRAEAPPVLAYMGHTLDLTGCTSLTDAAWRAVTERWIVYLDHRGSTVGLRLLPPTDGVRVRLRAPLVNVLAADVEPAPSAPVELGAFVPLTRLVTGTVTVEHDGQRLSLHGCRSATGAAARAVDVGWSVNPCVRDGLPGLMLAPSRRITSYPFEVAHDQPNADDAHPSSARTAEIEREEGPTDGPILTQADKDELAAIADDLQARSPMPVCPRCLDIVPGEPAGDPSDPHPGPFSEDLCRACACTLEDQHDRTPARPIEFTVVPPGTFEREAAELRQRIADLSVGDAIHFASGPHTGRIAHVVEVSADKPKAQLVGREVEIVDAIDVPGDAVEAVGSDPDDASLRPSALTKRPKKKAKPSGVEGKVRAKDGKRRTT